MRLKDEVVIVTGGAGGIGAAAVKLFAEEGAKVVVADKNQAQIEKDIQSLGPQGYEVIGVHCDVTDSAQVRNLIDETIGTFGRLDVLFNNAGAILPKPLEDIEEYEWDGLFQVNVKSMFLTVKHAYPYLREVKGRIINMASMTGVTGQQKNPAYSATKGAVIAFTKALAIDTSPEGVRVNAVCPAGVNTPLLENFLSQQSDPEQARLGQDRSHLLGYTASAEEIARATLFLACNESSFVTGEALTIDGGATLGYGSGIKPEWHAVKDQN